ncbi:MAG TPA: hypothetical protein VKU01_21560 [Bryobacteraceae bacterium]|nr:hypothetical protein [Bryobacteraceae bacterium]
MPASFTEVTDRAVVDVASDRARLNSHVPALVLGSGLTGVGVIRCLGWAGVHSYSVCDSADLMAASRWYRPLPNGERHCPNVDDLPDFLSRLKLKEMVLIPSSDEWVQAVSRLPEDFNDRFPRSIPSVHTIEILTDKARFAWLLERLGVPRPRTIVLHSVPQMQALEESSYQNMFLKPVDSQAFSKRYGLKGFLIKDKANAVEVMQGAQESGPGAFPILLQEHIPGPPSNHYFVDGFMDRNGAIPALFARHRLRMYPPRIGNTAFMETMSLEPLAGPIKALKALLADQSYRGIFSAEFKFDDRDGEFKMIEVNARPWWFIELPGRCGVNFAAMVYNDALGLPVQPVDSYPVGRRCMHFLNDYLSCTIDEPGLPGVLRWLRSCRSCLKLPFGWDDPMPWVVSTAGVVKDAVRRRSAVFRRQ